MKRVSSEMAELVFNKLVEMESSLADLLASDVSENTKRTQKFQRGTAIHNMKVLYSILLQVANTFEDPAFNFSEEEDKWFNSMITLTAERKAKSTIEVKVGDSILDLLNKYKDVKDVYAKIQKAVANAGLKIDMSVPGGVVTK